MKNFVFSKIPQTYFGPGSVKKLGELSLQFGSRAVLITGGDSYINYGISALVEKSLKNSGIAWQRFPVSGEPSPQVIDQIVEAVRKDNYNLVIAVGGGSVLDAGKAVAAMIKEEGGVREYLEGVGSKSPSGNRLALIGIPTTSGTGSEATKNAVISEIGEGGFKKSLRHDNYVPDYAIIDPELTVNCSANITASSGMDAFTQLLESYLSKKGNVMTDALALSGLENINRSLFRAFQQGNDLNARFDIAYSAYLSGITLANAGLGLSHGFAQPLGSMFPIPHGVVCGRLMYAVNKITLSKLLTENGNAEALKRYARVGKLFAGNTQLKDDEAVKILLNRMEDLTERMKIPGFGKYGVSEHDFPRILQQTSHKEHPIELSDEELIIILKDCL